jgi:hypothetical protein
MEKWVMIGAGGAERFDEGESERYFGGFNVGLFGSEAQAKGAGL